MSVCRIIFVLIPLRSLKNDIYSKQNASKCTITWFNHIDCNVLLNDNNRFEKFPHLLLLDDILDRDFFRPLKPAMK